MCTLVPTLLSPTHVRAHTAVEAYTVTIKKIENKWEGSNKTQRGGSLEVHGAENQCYDGQSVQKIQMWLKLTLPYACQCQPIR